MSKWRLDKCVTEKVRTENLIKHPSYTNHTLTYRKYQRTGFFFREKEIPPLPLLLFTGVAGVEAVEVGVLVPEVCAPIMVVVRWEGYG